MTYLHLNPELGQDTQLSNLNGNVHRERNKINQDLDFCVKEITAQVRTYYIRIYVRCNERNRIKYIYHLYICISTVFNQK